MSVIPQGRAVQSMYRDYVEGRLKVNRQYQRKLVWTLDEKQRLIDSILQGYPIPLILLAERNSILEKGNYEIIDGIQRLNAVFSYIEQAFDVGGKYFDIGQFATARTAANANAFAARTAVPLLESIT